MNKKGQNKINIQTKRKKKPKKEDDPTPFMTWVKSEKAKKHSSFLADLKNEEPEIYKKLEERHPEIMAGILEELSLVAKTREGEIYKMLAVPKPLLHVEKLRKMEKNPDLVFLCWFGNHTKVIYNKVSDEFWALHLKPVWVKHRRTMQIESWEKLEEHDFDTMLALGIVYHRDFHNPMPREIYLRNALKRKIKKILGRFKEWKSY